MPGRAGFFPSRPRLRRQCRARSDTCVFTCRICKCSAKAALTADLPLLGSNAAIWLNGSVRGSGASDCTGSATYGCTCWVDAMGRAARVWHLSALLNPPSEGRPMSQSFDASRSLTAQGGGREGRGVHCLNVGFIRSMESANSSMRVTIRCIAARSPEPIGSSSAPCGNAFRLAALRAVASCAFRSARRASKSSWAFHCGPRESARGSLRLKKFVLKQYPSRKCSNEQP